LIEAFGNTTEKIRRYPKSKTAAMREAGIYRVHDWPPRWSGQYLLTFLIILSPLYDPVDNDREEIEGR